MSHAVSPRRGHFAGRAFRWAGPRGLAAPVARVALAMALAHGAAAALAADTADHLAVLTSSDGSEPGRQLERWLLRLMERHDEDRLARLAALRTRGELEAWQRDRRAFFLRQLGGLPERTPLEARTVGRLQGTGYRVENVIFASRPGHHVTANLYLPDAPGRHPGVIVPCGHSHDGKAAAAYQSMCILLAKHGMVALCYDPIGQGERYQMLDFERDHTHFLAAPKLPVPHPRVRHLCTTEHTAMGLGCILVGGNVAQYRVWDGMRAIDYLQERAEVDPDRIGCTGNSGGGTLTSYLMALDDRIVAAAPACYLTTFRRLIETKGAQDAEQNIFGQLAFGMDEADYVIMRAPKPTLICAGRRDITFDIDGTWETFRQAKTFAARLGFPERVDINDADLPHGFYLPQREAAARWLHRWLIGGDRPIQEVDPAAVPDPPSDTDWRDASPPDWTAAELTCTPEGQVLLRSGERSVFAINADSERSLRPRRQAAWAALSADERRALVRSTIDGLAGEPAVPAADAVAPRHVGSVARPGYRIDKVVFSAEEGIDLPALSFIPDAPGDAITLYLHGTSMKADAGPGGPIEALVRQGHVVHAVELRGIGETETGHHKADYGHGSFGRDVQEIFLAYLLGRSYVGMRARDVTAACRALIDGAPPGDAGTADAAAAPRPVHLVAIGEAAIPALHAAALEPERFASVRLVNMLPAWADLVASPGSHDQAVNVVHGALLHYDLPDLVELAGGVGKVSLEAPLDAWGRPVP
jgi:dienelactone hydrolase